MRQFYTLFALLFSFAANAQVKIGDNPSAINANSILELEATNKGFVPPRVALVNIGLPNPLSGTVLAGTIVYNTGPAAYGPGLYCWNGFQWNYLAEVSKLWGLEGNSGTNPSLNFLGTVDDTRLSFRQNNNRAGYLHDGLTAFGVGAMENDATFGVNTAVGSAALFRNTSAFSNVAVGNDALFAFNFANGGIPFPSGNTAIGAGALAATNATNVSEGRHNTAIGFSAGLGNTTGFGNTFLGANATATGVVDNSTAIGYEANVTTSDALILGRAGTNAPSIGIGVTAPLFPFHFNTDINNGTASAFFQNNQMSHGTLLLASNFFNNGQTGATSRLIRAEGLGNGVSGHTTIGLDAYIIKSFAGINKGMNSFVSGGDENTGIDVEVQGNGNNHGLRAIASQNPNAYGVRAENATADNTGYGTGIIASTRQQFGSGGYFMNQHPIGTALISLANGSGPAALPADGAGAVMAGAGLGSLSRGTLFNGTGSVSVQANLTPVLHSFGSGAAATGQYIGMHSQATDVSNGVGIMAAGNNQSGFSLTGGGGGAFTGATNGIAVFTFGVGEAVYSSTPMGTTRMNYFDGATQFKINGTGTVSTIVKDLQNKPVTMAAPEAPEILFEDYGQAKLINGKVHIDLDPVFAKNVVINEHHPLRVFIQLEGDCKGVFVTNKSATGFDVQELSGGKSNTAFQWHVVCNRADEVLRDGTISRNADFRFQAASPDREVIKGKTIPLKTKTP